MGGREKPSAKGHAQDAPDQGKAEKPGADDGLDGKSDATVPGPMSHITAKPDGAEPSPTPAVPPPANLPVPLPDPASLSEAELTTFIGSAKRELEQRRAKMETDFCTWVREQARERGIPLTRVIELLARKAGARSGSNGSGGSAARQADANGTDTVDRRKTVKMKFWNPKDHTQRWSGRGTPKKWYTAHVDAGGKEEDMLIPPGGED